MKISSKANNDYSSSTASTICIISDDKAEVAAATVVIETQISCETRTRDDNDGNSYELIGGESSDGGAREGDLEGLGDFTGKPTLISLHLLPFPWTILAVSSNLPAKRNS